MMENDAAAREERTSGQMSLAAKIVLFSSGIPVSFALSTLAPILPKIEAALSHTDMDRMLVKMVIGIVGIAVVFGAPVAGILGDRMNRARIMTWAFAIFAIFGASGFLISDLWLMVGTRLLMGLAASTIFTLGFAMAGDVKDDAARRRYTGWAISIAAFSGLIGLLLGGLLGDIDWRLTFLIFLAPLPLSLFAHHLYKAEGREAKGAGERSATAGRGSFKWPIRLMMLALASGIIQYVPLTYVPFYMRNVGISSSTLIGMALMAQSVLVAISSSLFGPVRARLSADTAFGMSFVLMGLGIAGTIFSHQFVMIAACQCLIGLGAGWLTPNLMVSAGEAAEVSTRARYVGVVKAANMSATFVGLIVAEPILRAAGVSAVLITVAAGAFAMSLLFFGVTLANGRRVAPI